MSEKSRNRNRIPSLRRPGWDYATEGVYFITICTQSRIPHFGLIQNGQMILSDAGVMAQAIWQDIPNHFAFIRLDTFIIMPDHMHGLLIIQNDGARLIAPHHSDQYSEYRSIDKSIHNQNMGGITGMKNPMLHDNISRVIRWYKGRCTFDIRKILPEFQWQRNFYDRIVRDDSEWYNIQRYIQENPKNWDDDIL